MTELRAARPGDVGAMVAMERAAEMAPHWTEAMYAEAIGGGLAAGGGRQRSVLVVEATGAVVGFGVVSVVAGVAEVENLVVAAGARRAGMGRALCGGMVAWARTRAACMVELEVRAGNDAAAKLYQKLGFLEVGRRRGYYSGGEDAVLMRLRLREEA